MVLVIIFIIIIIIIISIITAGYSAKATYCCSEWTAHDASIYIYSKFKKTDNAIQYECLSVCLYCDLVFNKIENLHFDDII